MTSGNEEILRLLKESGDDEAELDLKILSEEYRDEALAGAVMRRASGEPLAYILGYRHFYKECYKVCPGVLIPRGDTEIVVESALKILGLNTMATGDLLNIPAREKNYSEIRFADLCTGTGCIGISFANEIVRSGVKASGVLVDVSDTAIDVASSNVALQALKPEDIRVIRHDVLSGIPDIGQLDLIMSNPPYITDKEMDELDSVVKDHEPDLALRAGEMGLDFYGPILDIANSLLKEGGALIVEHGCDQGDLVREIFGQGGLKDCMTIRDYGSNPRVTIGFKKQ